MNAVAKSGDTESSEEERDRIAYEWLTKEIGKALRHWPSLEEEGSEEDLINVTGVKKEKGKGHNNKGKKLKSRNGTQSRRSKKGGSRDGQQDRRDVRQGR